MLYLRPKLNLSGHILEHKRMHVFLVTYVMWVNYAIIIKWNKKGSIVFQCPVCLGCITDVFGDRSPGSIPETLK